MSDNNSLAVVLQTGGDFLVPAAPLDVMLAAYQSKKEFIQKVLKDGTDFGKIPGAGDKPALFKAGAEKMTSFFGLSPRFEDIQTVEDWTGKEHDGEPFFFYRQKCSLYRGDRFIGSADGSCNSWEKKYRYRNGQRVCPNCQQPAIFQSKDGSGFYCWQKKGGCGAKFGPKDPKIISQEAGQVKNPDISEQVNTILKMAQKRALVAAVLIATNTSDYFTQDIEDYISGEFTEVMPVEPIKQAQPDPIRKVSAPVKPEPVTVEAVQSGPSAYDLACDVTDKNGKRYGDKDTESLHTIIWGIEKTIKAGVVDGKPITDEQRIQYEAKRHAAQTIIDQREYEIARMNGMTEEG